jgi:hypothetical protein
MDKIPIEKPQLFNSSDFRLFADFQDKYQRDYPDAYEKMQEAYQKLGKLADYLVKKTCIVFVFDHHIFAYCLCASAHSGSLDGKGGHRSTSTGDYHYHHGYPAHSHENGICPYNFDDKTNFTDIMRLWHLDKNK